MHEPVVEQKLGQPAARVSRQHKAGDECESGGEADASFPERARDVFRRSGECLAHEFFSQKTL